MIPIDEQIAFLSPFTISIPHGKLFEEILDSLKELQNIKSQPVPVEPYKITVMRTYSEQHGEVLAYIDSLQSALQVAQKEYSDCQAALKDERYCHGETIASLERTASEQIQAAHTRAEKADERNKRLVELLKALLGALKHPVSPTQKQWDAIGVVSNNILLELGK